MISLVVVLVCSVFVLNTGAWAQPVTVGSPSPIRLVDQAGKVAGIVTELTPTFHFFYPMVSVFGGRKVVIYVSQDRHVLRGYTDYLLFESTDCTGTVYTDIHSGFVGITLTRGALWTLYVPNGHPRTITVGSIEYADDPDVSGNCTGVAPYAVEVVPMKKLGDLRSTFQFPLKVQ